MNILPKKRWHVRTKDNVARIRRDEAQAAADEKARLERAALAEQEARTSLLRSKVAAKRSHYDVDEQKSSSTTKNELDSSSKFGHVNFFADLEEKERTFGANKERKEEIRLEKEAEEKKIGLLKYLGEGSSEYMKETPWYEKVPQRPDPAKERNIMKQIEVQKSPAMPVIPKSTSKRKKKSKKHENHESKSSSSASSDSEEDAVRPQNFDLETLRRQRLEREKAERLRSEQLMQKMRRGTTDKDEKPQKEKQVVQKYSSQFNPDFARQNR